MGLNETEKKIETLMSTEVKSMVAKLLSKENITIQRGKYDTASFDIKSRVLRLPLWENMSNDELDLFIGHEVSHALNTPKNAFEKFSKKCKDIPFSICNVVEDIRIEKLIQKEYPGLIRSFTNGYTALYNKDFFKLDEIPMEDRGLIDRINIKAKLRKLVDVPFSEEELPLVRKAFNCKSYDDVLTVVSELKDWVDKNEPEEDEEEATNPFSNNSSDNNDSSDDGSESNSDWTPSDDGITDESFNEALEDLEKEYKDLSSHDDGYTDDGTEAESEESEDDSGAGRNGSKDGRYSPASQKAFEESLDDERLDKDDYHAKTSNIFNMVDWSLKDIKKTIIPYSELLTSRMENDNFMKFVNNTYKDYTAEYIKFNSTSKKFINNLKSEFEMKKSAYQYSRATTAKSGVLDVNKLHAYKYSEDIFSSITTLADAKSHGMFFIVDMSASMSNDIGTIYKQAINLTMFCKAVGIPFKVYGFTNNRGYGKNVLEENDLPEIDGAANLSDVKIIELLSSDMKKNEWKQALYHTFLAAECFDSYYGQEPSRVEDMSGTPLSETTIIMTHLIKEFKEKHRIQKMSTMFLTDGSGQGIDFHGQCFYGRYGKGIGKIAGKMAVVQSKGRDGGFTDLINHLRDVTGSTVSHFFLTGNKNEIHYAGYYYMSKEELKQYRNDKIVVREKGQAFPHEETNYIGGMDKVFIMNSNKRTDLSEENNFSDVDTEDMTDAQLSRAFINNQTSRKTDRVFVNKFMEMVA